MWYNGDIRCRSTDKKHLKNTQVLIKKNKMESFVEIYTRALDTYIFLQVDAAQNYQGR